MPLTMTERRYAEIRAEIVRRRLKAKVEKIRSEPDGMTFATVDAFFDHLDNLVPPEDPSPRPPRKRR